MGKVRPSNIKILSRILVNEYGTKFTLDFETNKKVLDQIADMKSKAFRNRVAGYITRLIAIRESNITGPILE